MASSEKGQSMNMREAGQQWEALHQRWVDAHQEARRMEQRNLMRFKAFAEGKGAAPSAEELGQVEPLRRIASAAQADRDEFTRRVFRGLCA
jgi:hypothetical protein